MKRLLTLLLLLVPVVCAAQPNPVLILENQRYADLQRSFGVEPNTDNSTVSAANWSDLQAQLDAWNVTYPWYLQVGSVNMSAVQVDRTLRTPYGKSGLRLMGGGVPAGLGGTNLTAQGSRLTLKAASHQTTFDGTTNKLSTAAGLTITNTSNANPIVVTAAGHGLITGACVTISGVTGNTNANGTFRITRIDDNSFSLQNQSTNANIDGTAGGAHGGTPTCLTSKAIVTGREVGSWDIGNTVEITGGTNVLTVGGSGYTNWHGIVGVVPGASEAGIWILGTMWNSGTSTNGAGFYCPEIWQDNGFGNVYEDVDFNFQRDIGGESALGTVAMHLNTNFGTSGAPIGKGVFRGCSFDNTKIGILQGRHLTGYEWKQYAGDNSIPSAPYRNDDHGDHLTTYNCHWGDCEVAHMMIHEQCLSNSHYSPSAGVSEAFIYSRAGGRTRVHDLNIYGNTGTQCVLKVGPDTSSNSGQFEFYGTSTDAGNTRNPQLIVTDFNRSGGGATALGRKVDVLFSGGSFYRNSDHDSKHLIDIQSGTKVTVRDSIFGVTGTSWGMWADAIRLKVRVGELFYTPLVILDGIDIDASLASPSDVIDDTPTTGSDNGCFVMFRNCYQRTAAGPIPIPTRMWLTGTGWVTWHFATNSWTADPELDLETLVNP